MRSKTVALALVLVLLVAACAHQPPPAGGPPLPGLLLGLLHGYISFFSLIASLFFEVRIYAFPNAGFFYDLGFVIGAFAFYGSGSRTYSYTYSRWR
ncbi:hypothetical protein [Reyranella sp.]|jgi:hypothetical protein|uniref:hypothetical protein n=1 Tax=Reyranella sp. TaxID=1929291 RepID=UPI002F95F203